MTRDAPEGELARVVRRKAARVEQARRAGSSVWSTLGRVVGLGWVFILPLVLGVAIGRWLALQLGRPWIAMAGLFLGLFTGGYGVYLQIRRGLFDDAAPVPPGAPPPAPEGADDGRDEEDEEDERGGEP